MNRAIDARKGEYSIVEVSGKLNARCKVTLVNNCTGNIRHTSLYDFIKYPDKVGALDKGVKISAAKRSSEAKVLERVNPLLIQNEKQLIKVYHKNYKWWLDYSCSKCSTLNNGGVFNIELTRLESKGFNCKCHSKGFRRSKEDVVKEIELSISKNGKFKNFIPEYTTYNDSKVEWVCDKGHTNIQLLNNMRRSNYNCPRCVTHGYNPDKPAYFYLVQFEDQGTNYLKYGITNRKSPDDRLKQIFKKVPYEKLLTVSSDGYTILDLENIIKKTFNFRVEGLNITSGFTEIIHIDFREILIKIIYNFMIGE